MLWEDVEWIRDRWSGPLAVKGAFTPTSARRLSDIGINVLLLGNHGGRQLDGLQTGLEQLPAVLDVVGDRVDLVIDGGVRRGSDVIKAICLGARACTIGRACRVSTRIRSLERFDGVTTGLTEKEEPPRVASQGLDDQVEPSRYPLLNPQNERAPSGLPTQLVIGLRTASTDL
jgi:hypothetical protein